MATRGKTQLFGFSEFVSELRARDCEPRPHETDKRKWIAHVPGRVDVHPSLEFWEDDDGYVWFFDTTGELFPDEIAESLDLDYYKAKRSPLVISASAFHAPHRLLPAYAKRGWVLKRFFIYHDELGREVADKVRLEHRTLVEPATGKPKKKCYWRRITEDGMRLLGLKPCRVLDGREYTDEVRPSLYRLPDLLRAMKDQPHEPIHLAEGEPCVDRLWDEGYIATCNPDGGGRGKWSAVESIARKLLVGRRIYVHVDNDAKGEALAFEIGRSISAFVPELRLVRYGELCEKGDVLDWFESGGGTDERFEEKCQQGELVPPVIGLQMPSLPDIDGRPTIVVNDRPAQDVSEAVQAAVVKLNNDQTIPRLCKRGGVLHRIKRKPTPVLEVIDNRICGRLISEACRLVRCTSKSGLHHVPSASFVENYILAGEDWPVPEVQSITRIPLAKQDGTLFASQGYDADLQRILIPSPGCDAIKIPEQPTSHDIRWALRTIIRLFHQFPFADRESRRNLLAALITTVLRSLIDGCVPLFIIAATDAGTGKTLTWAVISILVTGDVAPIRTLPNSDAQMTARRLRSRAAFHIWRSIGLSLKASRANSAVS